ncbi:Pat-12 [Aphelenchoides besseyi]|nr:Pat-12 [Aphelenchoides besseyi]
MQQSSSQYSAQQQASEFKVVTPLYKTHDNPSIDRSVGGGSLADLTRRHAETNGDYKAERKQESFRMQIIDPKVDTNAYIPAHAQTQFPRHKSLMDDFPSHHNKRSLLKLDAMEQRKIRSTESRPITTNAYLNESVDRHRAMEASKLREHLKAREDDANKPWNKPAWPESNANEESLRELEQIRKSIETLQKVVVCQTSWSTLEVGMSMRPIPFSADAHDALPDPGRLIRQRKQQYLNKVNQTFDRKSKESCAIVRQCEQNPLIQTNAPTVPKHANQQLKHTPSSRVTDQYSETVEEYAQIESRTRTEPTLRSSNSEYFTRDRFTKRMSPSPGQEAQVHKSILKNPMPPPAPPPPPPMSSTTRTSSNTRLKTRQPNQPLQRPSSVSPGGLTFQTYEEHETYQLMQENLRQQRNRSQTSQTSKPPTTSFNGPFFRLEEVSPSSGVTIQNSIGRESQPINHHPTAFNDSALSPDYGRQLNYGQTSGETVVIWPPPDSEPTERSRPTSVTPRNITDPERVGLFERQKQLEYEAMRRYEEKQRLSEEKQLHATKLQQQRGNSRAEYRQYAQTPTVVHSHHTETASPASSIRDTHTPMLGSDPGPTPNLRVYETRPISALSGDSAFPPSWKRTYMIDDQEIAARNEILRSDEILERERFEVDLLQRREAFIEKPEPEPTINRIGRRWQPPPERPYIWPQSVANESAEYQWEPVVGEPTFKHERKNFTPTHSPPHSPRRGRGTRPLDEVAQRQTRNLIQPSPDGSHRPKPAFKTTRSTPSGGFVPHAPNAVKVVKKRSVDVHGGSVNRAERDVEVIHESTFHLVNDPTRRRKSTDNADINDWEKIYDLPPHSSTVTNRETPSNVDVRRRLQLFEHRRRSQSAHHSYESYRDTKPLQISTVSTSANPRSSNRNGGSLLKTASPVKATRTHIDSNHLHPGYSPQDRAPSARSQHSIRRIVEATQPSPPPPSYENARRYVPPALPPGIRRTRTPQRRSPPPQQPGNTQRLMQVISNEPKKHNDLDELARKNRELAERSRSRRHDFKIVESEIVKTEPEQLPAPLKNSTFIRDSILSRISTDISTPATASHSERNGYATDLSTTTWQYNSNSFSPRSVVSINGGQEGLLKIRTSQSVMNLHEIETKPWPHMPANLRPVADSPQSTMTRELNETYARRINRYNSMPALETASSRGTLIKLQEEKPRSIMKVREVHEVVSKPKVTETVQRVEERKRTEEIERRVLRRERRHKSHRSRYGHSHQEALGWNGASGGSAYHRSNSMSRGGYDYGNYVPPAYPNYNTHYSNHHNAYYNGHDFPPHYPRRTASAMLYH